MWKRAFYAISQYILAGSVLLSAASVARAERGKPAVNGMLNFGQVTTNVYRGAQPDMAAVEELKNLGIKTIISLCRPGAAGQREECAARRWGIVYTNVPLSGFGRPTSEQVERVLSLIATCRGPVFVHCHHGADRTGLVVACYRVRQEGWGVGQALSEARAYGLSKLQRGMRHFVEDFAAITGDHGLFLELDKPRPDGIKVSIPAEFQALSNLETNSNRR